MPSEFRFEPCSPRYGPFLVLGLFDINNAHSSQLVAIFGPFLGYIVELEGNKGLFVTGQLRGTWNVATVSLRLAVLSGFRSCLGPKKGYLRAQNAHFWEGICQLGAPAPGGHR